MFVTMMVCHRQLVAKEVRGRKGMWEEQDDIPTRLKPI